MKKKNKLIYEQPRRYAKKCHIPIKYAREVCKKQLKCLRQVKKHSFCPYCGKHTLERDYSDDEYSNETWIYCTNCDKDINERLFPKLKVPKNDGEDFDVFLWSVCFENVGNVCDAWWIDFIKENK